MASEFAMTLVKAGLDAKDGLIQDALDGRLTEIRQAFNGLVRHHLSTGPCWCPSRVSEYGDWLTPGEHDEHCNRTRTVYEKLRIDK
jgi:hypothetical protein